MSGFAAPSFLGGASKLALSPGEGATAPSRTPDGVGSLVVGRPLFIGSVG
jgi:hypothetical protein